MKAVIYLCIIFIAFANAQNCGQFTCSSTDMCCNDVKNGYQCYNPGNYQCQPTSGQSGNKLCAIGDQGCGTECYDPSQYNCVNAQIVQGSNNYYANQPCGNSACTAGNQCCNDSVAGMQCYDTATEVCVRGTKLCPQGLGACGNTCYDTASYHCSNGKLAQGPETCSLALNQSACVARSPTCAFCSPYYGSSQNGHCYNSATESCCGQYEDDCYNPLVCSSSAPKCVVPIYGCEYAGSPVCCQSNAVGCSAMHNAACCTSSQSCCSNFYYTTCCDAGSVCCKPSNANYPSCCPPGSSCNAQGGCA